MNELMDKLDELFLYLDNTDCIKEIRELNKVINNDKELISLIEEYKLTRNEEIRKKIVSNELYSRYKHLENEVNFMILDIRTKLKTIDKSKGGCGLHESN